MGATPNILALLHSFGTFNKVALTQAQLDATDAFINALDLSNAVRDADGSVRGAAGARCVAVVALTASRARGLVSRTATPRRT